MAEILIGSTVVTHDTGVSAGAIILQKHTAVSTGTMTEFQIKCEASGNVKVAIYSDNAGTPNALLGTVGSTAVTATTNAISFPSTPVVGGTDYWLAFNFDTDSLVSINATGGTTLANESANFGDAFPDPYPGSYTSKTWNCALAGYGNIGGGGHQALII